ncbi:MAG: tetraacyldisaccharide 4'-kinase [Candidatus Parabeggiatoa sp. nov. 1]|nr:MAG: tetraacyldisaccharide 4'-kinase [Gammaproteobacteria bacterium]
MTFNRIWYGNHPLGLALAPLSWLFCAIAGIRRQAYKHGLLACHQVPMPVIVVGNITVGGTGKTPLVIWLVQFLKKQGFKPGIVSRGYGGRAKKWPQLVHSDSDPYLVGDEPVLLARQSGCPVAVAKRRIKAVQSLLENDDCNLIISDDGLQHYALHRDIEIAVLDGIRLCGNRRCLPAGPLRESVNRLEQVDFIVTRIQSKNLNSEAVSGNCSSFPAQPNDEFTMQYEAKPLRRMTDDNIEQPLSVLHGHTVHAVAGIGHPAQFFAHLHDNGLKLHCHEFPDHHHYKKADIWFYDNLPVIMTEKDAVKCRHFASPQHWYLPIEAHLPNDFGERLLELLRNCI